MFFFPHMHISSGEVHDTNLKCSTCGAEYATDADHAAEMTQAAAHRSAAWVLV